MRATMYTLQQTQRCAFRLFQCRLFSAGSIQIYSTSKVPVASRVSGGRDFNVPLTIVDSHLRDEQLPFCYVFDEILDEKELVESFQRVIARFPVLGGRMDRTKIVCRSEDDVSISFARSTRPLSYWLNQGHRYSSGSGHPILLPLFQPLFPSGRQNAADDDAAESQGDLPPLATCQVTYCVEGRTAIGLNMNHALADAASCFRFMQCWSREIRKKRIPGGSSNDRQTATLAGMMNEDLADILYGDKAGTSSVCSNSFFLQLRNLWETLLPETLSPSSPQNLPIAPLDHEYLSLEFLSSDLMVMKAYGMHKCNDLHQSVDFVSTNDMVTAFGWLLKRRISGEEDWNISMVVNLRGQGNVDDFPCFKIEEDAMKGVFGNGITNVFASIPANLDTEQIGIQEVGLAACSIRRALTLHKESVSDRVLQSRLGRPILVAAAAGPSFATTSWQQFPLWNIKFGASGGCLSHFHGYPSHPLPVGSTFASVLIPRQDGGCTYKLLLPTEKVREARQRHEVLVRLFREWYEKEFFESGMAVQAV